MNAVLERLVCEHNASDEQLLTLLTSADADTLQALHRAARAVCDERYGKVVLIRGLIEFTNHCCNNCLYCGIRRDHASAKRYRLTPDAVLTCCATGYALGFRTFVLQGGEDGYFTDERLCALVCAIKQAHPDCSVTLSVGERSKESYRRLREAGADRYLLRHETIDAEHYARLHASEQSHERRMLCLRELRELGYQVGCGFMVGSPYQTMDMLVRELRFIQAFRPQMVGIGPFLPHHATPFAAFTAGSVERTLTLLSLIRLLLPDVLLPATTALGTVSADGRERGILAGANVVMPNLSPPEVRKQYTLYDHKRCTGDEAAEHLQRLNAGLQRIGYQISVERGDSRVH
ncbi:MAG: [FeFe] hydrogenase H-cluster radical SAM maturase HydE [Clostridia bacterium]